jgi:VIT family
MMAGAYLDVETTRDAIKASRASMAADRALDPTSSVKALEGRLAGIGLTSEQSGAIAGVVEHDRVALGRLMVLQGAPQTPLNPWEQALWMLVADFLAAAIPILPFILAPVPEARFISAVVTLSLLVGLGVGRARDQRLVLQTQMEEYTMCARVCSECLTLRRQRDCRTRIIQTLFGTVEVDAPRISVGSSAGTDARRSCRTGLASGPTSGGYQ